MNEFGQPDLPALKRKLAEERTAADSSPDRNRGKPVDVTLPSKTALRFG
jgi:hypothetical protein